MNFLEIKSETEEEFEEIARVLFDKYAIQSHDRLYRFTEIEFYWNSKSHVDNSTYKRNHAQPKSGDWFFHYSGVDIALNNPETGGYGGTLIRSIYDLEEKKIIKGPMVCAMKLFSAYSAFSPSIKTQIIPHKFNKSTIVKGLRKGLGQNAMENNADKLNYAFMINPKTEF